MAASIFVYIESFYGATVGSILQWVIPLGIGVFALQLPIYVIEKDRGYFLKGFARDMPSWVVPLRQVNRAYGPSALGLGFRSE